jgi:hypothetical protein
VPAPVGVWERCPVHMAMAKAGHALSAVCVAAMGGPDPLAKRVGAWPAVAAVTGVIVAAAGAVTCTAGPLAPQLPGGVRAGRHRRRW